MGNTALEVLSENVLVGQRFAENVLDKAGEAGESTRFVDAAQRSSSAKFGEPKPD